MQLLTFVVLCILCKIGATMHVVDNSFSNITIHAKNYFVFNRKADWFEAWKMCRFRSWYLVDVLTKQENNRILQIAKNFSHADSNFWLSSMDLANNSHYYWVTNGKYVEYANWAPDKPDNKSGAGHCLHFSEDHGMKWKNAICKDEMYFICRDTPDVPLTGLARRKEKKQQKFTHNRTIRKRNQKYLHKI